MSDDGLPGVALAVVLLVGLAVNAALFAKLLLIALSAAFVLVQWFGGAVPFGTAPFV